MIKSFTTSDNGQVFARWIRDNVVKGYEYLFVGEITSKYDFWFKFDYFADLTRSTTGNGYTIHYPISGWAVGKSGTSFGYVGLYFMSGIHISSDYVTLTGASSVSSYTATLDFGYYTLPANVNIYRRKSEFGIQL